MAEAVRKKRTRSKKVLEEKCLPLEKDQYVRREEEDPMKVLHTTYEDMPLPDVCHNISASSQTLDVDGKESVIENDSISTDIESEERKDEAFKNPEGQKYESSIQSDISLELCIDAPQMMDGDVSSNVTDIKVSNFAQLQRTIDTMEPYIQVQKQLHELMLQDQLENTETTRPFVQDEASAPAFEGDSVCESNLGATAPELDDKLTIGSVYFHEDVKSPAPLSEARSAPNQKTKITLSDEVTVEPLTEIQITSLYQNTELEENQLYISQFIDEERNIVQLEFYQLVLGYLRARTALVSTQRELSGILDEYKKQQKNIWVLEKRTVTEEAECEDNRLLTATHEYEEAIYKDEIASHVSKQLKLLREILSDSYALNAYASELSKLQVENYMQKVLSDCSEFMQLPKNARVSTSNRKEHSHHLQPHIKKLKSCISVLFAFQRQGIKDHQFVRVTRQWLTDLVAILQRVAVHQDHLFLINHVMRCPAGVGSWAPSYIQVGGPWHQDFKDGGMLGCWALDHALTILSTILNPTSGREDFLHNLKPSPSQEVLDGESNTTDKSSDSVWVVVDSSGEEEEDPSHLWLLFTENDVVQILNQVPFKEIFQHMLLIDEENDTLKYNVSCTSRQGLMKLFAFATYLIQLFRVGLETYSQVRYRGVTKRLCRFLRHTVEYITDHWHNYLRFYQSLPQHSSDMNQVTTQWAVLQTEYDQLFERAVNCMFGNPRSGAWQFLAVIPYSSVSLLRLWKIVYMLHVGISEDSDKTVASADEQHSTSEDWAFLVSHSDTRGQFHDRLQVMEENEAFYLLTALANMAITREVTEKEFVKVLVNNIYEATFVSEETREMLSRIGRDLLSAVATSHPFCMSFILTTTQEKLCNIGSMALYLFRALPLQLWEPSDDDITCVSHWLLFTPVPSIENQLARVIITKLNWNESTPKVALALPHQLHRRVALTVLESYMKVSREMSQRSILTEGVKQVTSVMYAPSPERVFCDWAWNLLTCLRLHLLDQPMRQVCSMLKAPSSLLKNIPDPTSAAIQQGSTMNVVKRGLMDREPLALYASLLLTTWGHSLPEFCEHGVDCVHELVLHGRYEAVLSALVHIMPLFFNQPEDITSNTKLMSAIQKCLVADQTYITLAKSLVASAFPGKVLNLFAAMLVHHIKNYAKFNLSSGAPVISFWMQVMICIPDWVHNNPVLFLLDTICHHAFSEAACWQEVMIGFSEVMKSYEDKHTAGGGLSGLLSWLTAGTTAPNSLLVRSSAPQFPWYTLAILMLETQQELSSGLWKNLLLELYGNPQVTLEEALKKVSTDLGISSVSSNLLSIYRWGQQVIDLPADHPALPVTLQMYLTLHLARVPPQPGQYECGCVVLRFYQGFVNSSFLGKIKKKVRSAVEHYEAKNAKQEEMEAEESSEDAQTGETMKLLNAMQLWLDEACLYESGVYLPALPPHLLPQKLMQIFQSNWEPWPESVNHGSLDRAADSFLREWDQHRNNINDSSSCSPSNTPGRHKKQLLAQDSSSEKDSTKTILKRLKTYEPPQPPPPIPPLSPLHLPHLTDNTLNDPEALLYLVQRYTDVIMEHSQTVSLWSKEMCALDCFYRELLPQLWTNFYTKKILSVECIPPKIGRKQPDCSGHASIVVEFSEARLCEGANVHIEQNRKQHDLVLQQCQNPPPLQLCQATVSLESIITDLVNEYRKLDRNKNKQRWMLVLISGRKLFYHIVQLTSDETNFYPPAKQLITSCAEVLGQEFICGHADCQESLVAQVLEWDGHFGGLLAPHFTPAVTPVHTYLTLYSSLSPHALISPDHTFMLLSKFDIERWLVDIRPSCSDQTQLVNTIGAALSSLLPQAASSLMVVLELYRVHLRTLLNYKFPEHYIEVLTVMLQVSATPQELCKEATIGMWYDLMNILGKGVAEFSPDMDRDSLSKAVKDYAQNQDKLSPTMIKDTLKMLSTYFVRQRLECGLYGLYPKYQLHVLPVATFIGLISHVYIVTEFHRNWGDDKVVQNVWTGIEGLWAGWIAPLSGRDRESGPAWLRQLTQDIRLLLPWAPSDVESADIMVHMFASSLNFMHQLIPDDSTILSMILEYYSSTFAMKEVRSHILVVIHNHLSALPWHHLHPSLEDTMTFTRVVEQYLPECHSFVGGVLVQVNWNKDIQALLPSHCSSEHHSSRSPVHKSVANPASIAANDPQISAAKFHQCLLNLLVRISMEPSVRQSTLLQTLLLDSENFYWWLVDGDSYQRVVNWWVMSCDPRIVLSLPDRNPVDIAVIQLLHRAAGYTPDTKSFHQDTGAKRSFLIRALVRLLTSATARHKALLSARPHIFETTIFNLLSHMQETLIATLPKEQQWSEGAILSTEVLALVSGGASSAALQELSCSTIVKWFSSQSHPSPGLLFPLLVTTSRTILHLNHRNAIMQAGLSALFLYNDWCGWEGEIHWPLVISSLSFPLTNPAAMMNLASQEGQLYVVYAYSKWQRQQSIRCADNLLLLSSLIELLGSIVPNVTVELGLTLLFSEILELITQTIKEPGSIEAVWQHCCTFASRLACWAEDRSSTGILAAIGLGRQSPLSPGARLVCRCLSTFLILQMPRRGVFRTHPCHPHSDVDESQTNGDSGTCTLEQLRLLSSNATYAGLTHPLNKAIQFIEDPAHCIVDVHILLAKLVSDVLPDPILHHLTMEANSLTPSAPPPPPV